MILRKKISILFFVILFIGGNICLADGSQSIIQTAQLALKSYHFSYSETIGDSETGNLNGVRFDYKSQNPTTRQYWRLTCDVTNQNTKYNGALQDGTPAQGTTQDSIVDTEVSWAQPLSATQYFYTGIGSHDWQRDLLGPNGYLEEYSWNYIPVGYRSEYRLNDKWNAAIDVAVKIPFNGTINVSGDGYDPRQMILGSKPGFRAEVPFTCNMSSRWSLVFTPWYEYFAIGQSNTVALTQNGLPTDNASLEPDSNTHQYGIDIGVAAKF